MLLVGIIPVILTRPNAWLGLPAGCDVAVAVGAVCSSRPSAAWVSGGAAAALSSGAHHSHGGAGGAGCNRPAWLGVVLYLQND